MSRWILTGLALALGFVLGVMAGAWWAQARGDDPTVVSPGDDGATAVTIGPGGCAGVESMVLATAEARRLAADAADTDARSGQLGELIFLEPPYERFEPGYRGPVTPFDAENGRRFGDLLGFVMGYSRTFIAPGTYTSGKGFVTAQVYEFASPGFALASLTQHLETRCQDTAATFTIPAIPDAVGISVRGSAPPVEDAVLFVRGPRRYLITRGLKVASADHAEAAALAVQAVTLAR